MLLLLALALQARDLVVARDGRRLEGRALEIGQIVEVEHDDGRRTRLYRHEVARVEPGADFPRCPEVLPFPSDLLERTEYDYASYRKVLVALPRRGGKIVAVDIAAARRLWELEVPDPLVPPFVAGSALYVLQIKKEPDPSRKLKIDGASVPKEVHRISAKAVDLESGEARWTVSIDNNDRRDVYWTVASNPAPTLHVLPDRVALRIAKDAWPVDAAGNCDKSKPLRYASFVSIDPAQKRVIGTVDSDDAAEAGGRPWFTPELVVLQVFLTSTSWRLVGVGAKDGKRRWESEPVLGTLHEVGDDVAYASDTTHFHAVSLKSGKRLEKPLVELGGGRVADVEGGFAFLYRKKAPRRIEVIDLKKGAVAFSHPMPDDDEFAHLRVIGRRLLFTDRLNRIHALDLAARKPAWTWAGAGPTFVQNPRLLGGGLAFYKDGRITLLDPASGRKLWDVKGSYRAVVPVGDEGFFAFRGPGADLVRRRRFDREGLFFTPTDTPLRYAHGGDETWSPPAVVDGVLYTLSSGAAVLAIDLAERKVLWSERLSKTTVNPLSAPAVIGDAFIANFGGETRAWALSNKGSLYQARHVPLGPDRPFHVVDGLWFACAAGAPLSAIDAADGMKAWESAARNVLHYALADGVLHAVSPSHYHRIDARTGETKDSTPLPRGVTAVAADGARAVFAGGPYVLYAPAADGVRPLWKAKTADPRIGQRFKGHVARAPQGTLYSHADGAVSYLKDGAEKEEWNILTPEFSSPLLVHGGRVWFAARRVGLVGVDLEKGTYAWKSEAWDAPLFTPILWEGKPAFWSAEGWLVPVKD